MAADARSGIEADYDPWLFDLDGTLVDTEWGYKRELFDRVEDRLGVGFDDDAVERVWYGLGGDRAAAIRAAGLEPTEFWAAFDALDDPVSRAEATYLYDDAAVVGALDGPVGLVTHCPGPITERVLDALDVRDWFDAVVCCSPETGWKPDPTPVERALATMDVAGPGGVYVGDGPGDVGAARNAGLAAVHVERHGHDRRGRCVLGDHQVRALTDL